MKVLQFTVTKLSFIEFYGDSLPPPPPPPANADKTIISQSSTSVIMT